MPDELVCVHVASGQVEANLIKSLLEAEGIPVMVAQEGAGAAYGLTVGVLGEAEIIVPEKFAAEARELLEEWTRGEEEESGGDGQTE
ncbi:MAG: DUF2007 domain-containing protein [Chloroflexi bacterium]|nr:DUF2007 domain-containing protein [Chloroflexota bacterium]